jgi:propanol-preferring alcohol dehydrogenase
MRLGLFGFGASASLAIQVARHRGAIIHVATRSEQDRKRAVDLGARSVGGYADPPPEPLDAVISRPPDRWWSMPCAPWSRAALC